MAAFFCSFIIRVNRPQFVKTGKFYLHNLFINVLC